MNSFVVSETDFYDPDPSDDYYHINLYDVLTHFRDHPNIRVRNGCLEALKKVMKNSSRLGYGDHVADTVDLFEGLIHALEVHIPSVDPGPSRTIYLKSQWYPCARETLADAYLFVMHTCSKSTRASYLNTARALTFLLSLQLVRGRATMSNTKALKHVVYYVSSTHPQLREKLFRELDKQHILEEFFCSQLERIVEKLCGEEFSQDSWEPIQKILEFMYSYKYSTVRLLESVRMMVVLIRQLRKMTNITESLDELRVSCLYDHALSLSESILGFFPAKPN